MGMEMWTRIPLSETAFIWLTKRDGGLIRSERVVAEKGTSHVFHRKQNDESHKTLMLGVCGNGDTLKPLVILENSFPLLGEGEADHLPNNILLSKTERGWTRNCFLNGWRKPSSHTR